MAEFPALPLFTDAYLADTRHLTTLQHGAFLLLLMTAWRTPGNKLPDDDGKLARWAGLDRRTWAKNKAVVMSFWCKDADQWRQKRLDDERKYVEQLRDKNSAAGKSSALKRKERHSTSVEPNSNQTSTPTPTPTPIAAKAARQPGKIKVFTDAETNSAKEGDEAWHPAIVSGEILPGGWYDVACVHGISDERIYQSWRKFKEKTAHPYQLNRWEAWLKNEQSYVEAA